MRASRWARAGLLAGSVALLLSLPGTVEAQARASKPRVRTGQRPFTPASGRLRKQVDWGEDDGWDETPTDPGGDWGGWDDPTQEPGDWDPSAGYPDPNADPGWDPNPDDPDPNADPGWDPDATDPGTEYPSDPDGWDPNATDPSAGYPSDPTGWDPNDPGGDPNAGYPDPNDPNGWDPNGRDPDEGTPPEEEPSDPDLTDPAAPSDGNDGQAEGPDGQAGSEGQPPPWNPRNPRTPTTPRSPATPKGPTTPKSPTTPATTPKGPTTPSTTPTAPKEKDFDRDGLPDRVETGTGQYKGPNDTGTLPNVKDSDSDGLTDYEEVMGKRGTLDLKQFGVQPNHRDLLVEYDWTADFPCGTATHSPKPSVNVLNALVRAFANAPVENPDGIDGIHLIQDYGQDANTPNKTRFTGGTLLSHDGVIVGDSLQKPFQDLKKASMASNRVGVFHWALMAHQHQLKTGQVDSSGNAEPGGYGFMVTLNCYGTEMITANTIMHELGHNLGLKHGGTQSTRRADVNCKPNYNSVMNYFYQFTGADNDGVMGGDGVLDYSRGTLAPLDEARLSNSIGIRPGKPWDWCSAFFKSCLWKEQNPLLEACTSGTFRRDINNDLTLGTLTDSNDWATVLARKQLIRVVVDPEEPAVCPPPPHR